MGQFDVYRNPGKHREFPLLIDVQSDVVGRLPTRIVVPLTPARTYLRPITRLQPKLSIRGVEYVVKTEELAPVPKTLLFRALHNVGAHRYTLLAALDLLFTGS
jgi:toxin CcdB